MKTLDRILQKWRMKVAARQISQNAAVLDVGCYDGSLARILKGARRYVGVDREIAEGEVQTELVEAEFPENFELSEKFNYITSLAVFEHIPEEEQANFIDGCKKHLTDDGKVVLTVPSPFVDTILDVLMKLRLLDGMDTEDHYHFDVRKVPQVFENRGFKLAKHETFQLGLNNLFVFERDCSP